ncbi:MAG: glycosyltransferase family 8 protein [Selenomonadaceae bacterium]|nr:glycosyltransferase family 8 protein [Selenomonadaceae bacterium]
MIHVSFGLYDKTGRYSKFVGTTMLSIFENTTAAVTVHILHDKTLTDENREKIFSVAARFGQTVNFYNVENFSDELEEFTRYVPGVRNLRVSIGTMYRFLLPKILAPDIKKIIYLDADIIVNLDLNELWQIDLGGKILAGVPEILAYESADKMIDTFPLCAQGVVRCEDYFNSGVLLIDLNLLRAADKTIIDGLNFLTQNSQCVGYPGQDIWNYCFASRALKLPTKFNRFTLYARRDKEQPLKKIYHYAGGSFGYGLTLDMNDALNRLWLKYFAKTPWFNEETIARLYEGFTQARAELKESALNLSAQVSGKTRAFFVTEKYLDTLVENFFVKKDEEIFIVKGNVGIDKMADQMSASRGKRIFFFLLPNFPFKNLEAAGFVRGEDFLDGFEFLPTNYEYRFAKGFEFLAETYNSYPFVAAL